MIKKTIVVLMLALNFAVAANVISGSVPFPSCLPCPDTKTGS